MDKKIFLLVLIVSLALLVSSSNLIYIIHFQFAFKLLLSLKKGEITKRADRPISRATFKPSRKQWADIYRVGYNKKKTIH